MKNLTWDQIIEKNQTKGELFKDLEKSGQVFDYALPQNWINYMADHYNIDYEIVRFSTVWLYPQDRPLSLCQEVCDKISEYYK